jgi:hypothetical protein
LSSGAYRMPNGGVVHRETAFGDELFDIAIGEGISQIPADRANNDRWFEVSPLEQSRPWFTHGTSLTEPTAGFATLPQTASLPQVSRPQPSPGPQLTESPFLLSCV